MKKNDKLQLAQWAVSRATKAGADDAAVDVFNGREVEITFRDGKIDQLAESTRNSLSLDIYANSRYSSHTTNDIRKESLEKFISEAVAMTKYLTEDEYRRLPDPKYYEGRQEIDLGINDPAHTEVTSEMRVKRAKEIEEVAVAQSDKIVSCTAYYTDSISSITKVHSNGMEGEREGTSFSSGAEVTVRDGDKGVPTDYSWATERYLKDLPTCASLGKEAAERALRQIGQTKIESGIYEMVIENRAASRIIGMLRGPMSARSLQQQNSFLDGKLGEKIGSEMLTVIDDPLIKGGQRSRTFDGEGKATKRRVLIDKGVLKTYFVDWYYGQKLGMEPTLSSPSNAIYGYGTESLDQLVARMTRGILVTSFLGGNSNSLTGDFSVGVSGLLVENGKIIKPVNEMNAAGNLTELWNKLVAVGNDPYTRSSNRRPSLYFKDIQFAGV